MKRSQVVTAVLLSPMMLGLTACSDDDSDDVDPTTMACRTYLLEIAGRDTYAEGLLTKAVSSGSWSPDKVSAALDAVATAAKDAGLVEDLSDDDFELYEDVVNASGQVYDQANPNGGAGLTSPMVSVFTRATDAARAACTSDD